MLVVKNAPCTVNAVLRISTNSIFQLLYSCYAKTELFLYMYYMYNIHTRNDSNAHSTTQCSAGFKKNLTLLLTCRSTTVEICGSLVPADLNDLATYWSIID